MSIPAGWAEFNDATAVIRGRMVAASGTFSGTFSADVIDAVDTINIRNGAVSAHYGFGFAKGSQTATFTIPAQPHASVVDVIVPIMIESWGDNQPVGQGFVEFYKNSGMIGRDSIFIPTAYHQHSGLGAEGEYTYRTYYMSALQCVRYLDLEVSPNTSTTYMVRLINSSNLSQLNPAPGDIWFWQRMSCVRLGLLGAIVVGCRKR